MSPWNIEFENYQMLNIFSSNLNSVDEKWDGLKFLEFWNFSYLIDANENTCALWDAVMSSSFVWKHTLSLVDGSRYVTHGYELDKFYGTTLRCIKVNRYSDHRITKTIEKLLLLLLLENRKWWLKERYASHDSHFYSFTKSTRCKYFRSHWIS